jgi:hypothetical protein
MPGEPNALTLADVLLSDVPLQSEEAVAITLAVAERLAWSEPPRLFESVSIRADGAVKVPVPAESAPALPARYADFLHALLRPDNHAAQTRVPGPLLLVMARARGEIDLPPFASNDDFRRALLRFLPEAPERVLAALVRARNAPPSLSSPLAAANGHIVERRVTGPRVDELRRMLRDSDLERLALLERERERAREAFADTMRPSLAADPIVTSDGLQLTPPERRTPINVFAILLVLLASTLAWRGGARLAAPATETLPATVGVHRAAPDHQHVAGQQPLSGISRRSGEPSIQEPGSPTELASDPTKVDRGAPSADARENVAMDAAPPLECLDDGGTGVVRPRAAHLPSRSSSARAIRSHSSSMGPVATGSPARRYQ